MSILWLLPLAGYFLGATPFGLLIVKIRSGRDVRGMGSGNIGAANVARSAGAAAGALTLALDAGKGALAVWLAMRLTAAQAAGPVAAPPDSAVSGITWAVATGFAAILGHLFPVWLRFHGGKGVATGAGVFAMICWPATAGALLVWAATVAVWRYVSLGSMLAAAALPPLTYFLYAPPHAPPLSVSLGVTLAAILIIVQHRGNIARLIRGEEPRFTLRGKM